MRPGGGLQVMVAILAGMIEKDRGFHYSVLWSDPNTERIFKSRFEGNSNISFFNPVGSTNNMRLFLWQMSRLKGYLKTLKADIVLGLNHHFPCGGVPQIIYHVNVLRFERPIKTLFTSGELANRLRDWRAKSALKKASANAFESLYLQDLAKMRIGYVKNPNLIYIGLEAPNVVSAPNYQKDTKPSILTLTSPQPHKDNSTLIKTLAVLNRLRPNVHWVLNIAGGTNQAAFSDLRLFANQLGVADQINWLGFQNHQSLAALGAKALCLVSTSRVESFCMVAAESMSWSCPVIVCDSTSMPESVGDAGLLASPGDADDFARKIISLYEDENKRHVLIEKGYTQIGTMSWGKAADQFSALITTLVRAD